jgi:hypothetical protein
MNKLSTLIIELNAANWGDSEGAMDRAIKAIDEWETKNIKPSLVDLWMDQSKQSFAAKSYKEVMLGAPYTSRNKLREAIDFAEKMKAENLKLTHKYSINYIDGQEQAYERMIERLNLLDNENE